MEEGRMPIYEYQCKQCHHCFEKIVFSSDESETIECPQCGHTEVNRLISCVSAFDGAKSGLCSPGSSSGFS